jgi:hypothetical protein
MHHGKMTYWLATSDRLPPRKESILLTDKTWSRASRLAMAIFLQAGWLAGVAQADVKFYDDGELAVWGRASIAGVVEPAVPKGEKLVVPAADGPMTSLTIPTPFDVGFRHSSHRQESAVFIALSTPPLSPNFEPCQFSK